jgi:hypothetical protein
VTGIGQRSLNDVQLIISDAFLVRAQSAAEFFPDVA